MFNILLGFIIHPLTYITPLTEQLHNWVYLILFIWIFLETAFIVFSFLPGQSVLFLTGTIASTSSSRLNIFLLIITFIIAATTGAMIKYWYGVNIKTKNKIAQRINDSEKMNQTQEVFDENAKKSLIFSRFIPFVGLFIPIVAGTTQMDWRRFNKLNFAGVLLWVGICCFSGYFFGRTPFVKQYFTLIFLLLIVIPLIFETIWRKLKERVEEKI
jgi:membrane-associated protein